jgi:hypothetical protein
MIGEVVIAGWFAAVAMYLVRQWQTATLAPAVPAPIEQVSARSELGEVSPVVVTTPVMRCRVVPIARP